MSAVMSYLVIFFLAEDSDGSEGWPDKTNESNIERHESEFCLIYTVSSTGDICVISYFCLCNGLEYF